MHISKDFDDLVLVGNIQGYIVGRRYYSASIEQGEEVILERQPNNQHDSYAVRVMNSKYEQIGYIQKSMACTLSTCIDKMFANITGVYVYNVDPYRDEIVLSVYSERSSVGKVYDAIHSHFYQ